MTTYSRELGFAREVAELGGRIAMSHFGTKPHREQKEDGTWVTEADWAAEAQIRLRIARTWPDHNILGEEEGLTSAGGGEPTEGAPTWIVDPIDGTHNYMAGIPIWATLVALRIDGANVVGVAHAPALGETYYAAEGAGAFMNGEPIAVDPIDDLSKATVSYGGLDGFVDAGLKDFHDELVTRAWRTRGFGDFWGHMLVARGAAHVMVESELSTWDVAALDPIVTEAGGRLSHIDGSAWNEWGSTLTTNGALHDEVVELLSKTTPDWSERSRSPS
ncbi:MAG: inositol monophosphatase family protein [Actinomycetota bacterium]